MKLRTKYHGEIAISENEIITFENGIPGFLEDKRFVFLPFGDDSILFIMQSVSTSELAFVIANPFKFFKEYDFTLEEQVVEQLQLDSEKDVTVYVILTVQEPFDNSTANLQGPVVVNNKKQLGKQVILTSNSYQTKHPILKKDTVTAK